MITNKTFMATYLTSLLIITNLFSSTSFAEALNSTSPITPQEMVKRMGTGVDSTWSEVPKKINAYTAQATIDFANKGFKHFRLRINDTKNPKASDTWVFLDKQIQDALDNGVIPIIANQSHTFENGPSPENQAAWVQWWADMAEHYKDYPYELMFDMIIEIAARSDLSNEPVDTLNQAYEQVVKAIRDTGGNNRERIIIFSAHHRSDPTKLDQINIPSAGNGYLIGEFHEGYASGPSPDPASPHYYLNGTADEIARIEQRADAAIAWSHANGIPVWEGAWMPGNYNHGNNYSIDQQISFATDFINVMNDRGIPHSVNATKKFYDVKTNEWNELEPLVDHILSLSPVNSGGSGGASNPGNLHNAGSISYLFMPLFLLILVFKKLAQHKQA